VYGGSGIDEIHGNGEAHHTLYVGSGNDKIFISTEAGGTVIGKTGDDYLESKDFDCNLDGGDGDNTLNGPGRSNDDPNMSNYSWGSATLTGGLGADKFICSPMLLKL
jgi:Ca2+-binding RTX toxin-like protein